MESLSRLLKAPDHSFFLFGPRGTGKSTWLRQTLPQAKYFDLLDSSLSLPLSAKPHLLRSLMGALPVNSWVVLDEIQKLPLLLDEVHRLIEEKHYRFALCGSSARKLKRNGVNLLGGRALTLNLEAFSLRELPAPMDLEQALSWGTLPVIQGAGRDAAGLLRAYLQTYIREEIREESLVRRVEPFARFLQVAGLLNGQSVNLANVAAECHVPRSSVQVYFSILVDTLLGHFLPAYQPRLKVREVEHPKFYWFDPGVARAAGGLLDDTPDRSWRGYALETLIYHELRTYNEITQKYRPIAYYGTPGGGEIDFVIETAKAQRTVQPHVIGIEVKLATEWNPSWEKSLRRMAADARIHVDRMVGVYTGAHRLEDRGFTVYPVEQFIQALYEGRLF